MKSVTNNLVADAILASVQHYKKFPSVKLKEVRLSKRYWDVFLEYIKEQDEAKAIEMRVTEAIDFNDIRIRKGSILQVEDMVFDKDFMN